MFWLRVVVDARTPEEGRGYRALGARVLDIDAHAWLPPPSAP
jgi:hypothetical protein